MVKWKKSYLAIVVIVGLILVVVSGCGKKEETSSEGGSDEKPSVEKPKETPSDDETSGNFNEEGLPIVDDEITIRIAGSYDARTGSDWNELETFKMINKDTNVNIDWQLSPSSDYSEKRNLMLAGNTDLPDVMLKVPAADVVVSGSQGQFIALEDLIDKYAPNLTKFLELYPEVRNSITAPDGHIYSLPLANMAEYKRSDGNILWINTKWLDEVGMDMPETLDEFTKALKAFKAADLGTPLTAVYDGGQYGFGFLYGSFGTLDEKFLVRDGKVEFTRVTDKYKEVIKYLHELYADGLLDQEMFSQSSSDMLSKLAAGDKAEIGAFFGWSPDQITNQDYNWDYDSPIVPLIGENGDQATGYKNSQITQGIFTITSANENPEATMRWVDRAYDPEVSFVLRQGPNRVKETGDGKYEIVEAPDDYTSGEWRVKETPYNSFVYGFTNEQQELLDLSGLKEGHLDPDSPEWFDIRKDYLEKWIFPKILFTDEQYKGIARYETDIVDHTDQKAAEWITEGGIEEEWDSYIETLNKMGLEDYVKIYQDGHDTYIENSED